MVPEHIDDVAEILTVIDAGQHHVRLVPAEKVGMGHPHNDTVRRRAVKRVNVRSASFDLQLGAEGEAVPHPTLVGRGCQNVHVVAHRPRDLDRDGKAGGVYAIIIGDEDSRAYTHASGPIRSMPPR